MQWVDQATCRPFRCAVLPYVGNGTGHTFLDTGMELDLEHVYISDAACEAIAQALGWAPPKMVKALHEQAADIQQRLSQAEAEVAELQAFKESVDGLAKHGLAVRKIAGRKPAKEKVEA